MLGFRQPGRYAPPVKATGASWQQATRSRTGGTRTDLLDLVVLLYLPIVLIAAWIVTNLLTPAVLLNLIVLLYLTIVLILGLIVTRKP